VDIDYSIEWTEFATENGLGEFFTRHHVTGLAEKQLEQSEFDAGQIQWSFFERSLPRLRIKANVAIDERRRCGTGLSRAAEDGTDAGDEFARIEGLWDIIVGADFETEDFVDVLAARGENQHGNRRLRA